MPWCERCRRYCPDEELDANGGCPTCHEVIGEPPSAPWHFKLLVLAAVLYLGWRAVQGIAWVVERL